jgi:cobalt-zinc-cadmium efflux system outer membrane protein
MRTCIVRAAIAMALLPSAAGAQSLVLTESQALDRLSMDSPRVRAIRASADVARADALAAGRWPNPRVTVNREATVGITEYISTVGQVLPVTGKRGLAMSAASAHADAASSRADDQVRRVRADLRVAFITLVAATFREQEMVIAADRVRALATAIGKREAAGDAAGFDKLRAERAVLDVDTDVFVLREARASAEANLASFFSGVPLDSISVVPPNVTGWSHTPPPTQPVPVLADLIALAEQRRGELRALQQDVASAEFAERAAIRGLVPEPEIVAGTKSSNAGSGDIGGVLAVHTTIPLFDRAHPERASARARAAEARARADAFRTNLRAQLSALHRSVTERRERAFQYRASEPATRDLDRIANVSYDAGERGIQEVLEVYRTTAAARVRQIDLDLAVRQAEIELEFASGWELQ